jgi:thymidylate synthase
MRSVDLAVGLPYDIIVYALLQRLIAYETGLTPRFLRFFFGNAHIYKPHIENVREMMDREPKQQAVLYLDPVTTLLNFDPSDAEVYDYVSHGPLKFELFK